MAEDYSLNDPKISLVETVFVLMLAAALDAINWIPGLSILLMPINVAFMGIVHFWLHSQGGKWQPALAGNVVGTFIPIINQAFPRMFLISLSIHLTNRAERRGGPSLKKRRFVRAFKQNLRKELMGEQDVDMEEPAA